MAAKPKEYSMEFPPEFFKVKVRGEGRIITPEEKAREAKDNESGDGESVDDKSDDG